MERRELARLLSRIEAGEAVDIASPPSSSGDWRVLGVTGAPGVGKSCLVDRLVAAWVTAGQTVAVLAVDPSSAISGGALLGDRLRMDSVHSDSVYMRSIATRSMRGGLPARLGKMVDACLAAGWERVIIETVGAGQAELAITAEADRLLLVEGPSRGDVIQAEKAGILELADVIAVNKSDLAGAAHAADEIRIALQPSESSQPVVLCSAQTEEGISSLLEALDSLPTGRIQALARARQRLFNQAIENLCTHPAFDDVLKSLAAGDIDVARALRHLGE